MIKNAKSQKKIEIEIHKRIMDNKKITSHQRNWEQIKRLWEANRIKENKKTKAVEDGKKENIKGEELKTINKPRAVKGTCWKVSTQIIWLKWLQWLYFRHCLSLIATCKSAV